MGKGENCGFWGKRGKTENYFIIKLLKILRLFPIAVVGRPLSACRVMFSGIYARAQANECKSFFILPESLRSYDVDKNVLLKI